MYRLPCGFKHIYICTKLHPACAMSMAGLNQVTLSSGTRAEHYTLQHLPARYIYARAQGVHRRHRNQQLLFPSYNYKMHCAV